MGQVTYSKEFIDHLDSLIHILYEKEYFGYIESSIEYVLGIYDFLEANIYKLPHKKLPNTLRLLGTFFISYNSNHQTTWYIIFDKYDDGIYITFIFNNHEKFAQYLDL